jgi:triosephosphate isomerase
MEPKIVAGNWKMNKNLQEGIELTKDIINKTNQIPNDVTIIIGPPYIHLEKAASLTKDSRIKVAAQNCSSEEKGAFTGEVSAEMIKSTGAEYVILGHSERRAYFDETDELIYAKIIRALKHNLKPIVCCGEKLNERENGNHFDVVKSKIQNTILKLKEEDINKIIIAYEPVWAIGTGKTATNEQAGEMHEYIRKLITEKFGKEIGSSFPILYGGSCKPNNAAGLFSQPDINGGLIGGASLKSGDFVEIGKSFK